MIKAEEDVWTNYFKGIPNSSHLHYTLVPNFEKLDEICGKDCATGSRAIGPKQRQAQWEGKDNHHPEDDEYDLRDDANNEVSFSSKVAPNSTSKPSQEPKKKKTRIVYIVSEEIKYLKEGLDVVAIALEHTS